MKVKSEQEIKDFLSKYADEVGVTVEEAVFKQGKNPELTIFIDRDGGIDLDTCEKFHKLILEPIDDLDPTFGNSYTLNVSSLGADRPFKKEKDYLDHIGKMVEVKLVNAMKGKKAFDGVLERYDGKTVLVRVNEKTAYTLELKNIAKMNEYIDFN